MNKLKNLSKFLGVVIGLLLGQAVYAQKTFKGTNPPPAPVTYVTGSTALSRIDTKITQYLGQWKKNVANAQVKHQFYVYLRAYVAQGVNGTDAISAAMRKMNQGNLLTDGALRRTLTEEAVILLKQ